MAELRAVLTEQVDLADVRAAGHDKRVNIGFLTEAPSAEAVAGIDIDRSPGDLVVVEGEHVHLHYRVGQGSTKLTGDYFERTLGVGMTVRNLATVRTLAAMTSTLGP